MPLVTIIILAGLFSSTVFGAVAGFGWVSLRCTAGDDIYDSLSLVDDFSRAWLLTFVIGLFMTGTVVAVVAVVRLTGADIGMMIGG